MTDQANHGEATSLLPSGAPSAAAGLDAAMERFCSRLAQIERACGAPSVLPDALDARMTEAVADMWQAAEAFERAVGNDPVLVREAQDRLRERTHPFFSRTVCLQARTWPHGYQGDYESLEFHYRNETVSQGIGACLERYLLRSALGVAVRERKELLKDLLRQELRTRRSPRILDIACGPCREIAELSEEFRRADAFVLGIDHDEAALAYAREQLDRAGLPADRTVLKRYNALKMTNSARNSREFGMQDIIYSVGLFDYLNDDVLVRLLKALYDLLQPGGTLIVSFKDSRSYSTFIYHWLLCWNGFLQRTEADYARLFERAGLPPAPKAVRTASNVILFYTLVK